MGGIRRGVYLDTFRAGQVDERTFTFHSQIGWRIENGRLGGMIKNPFYHSDMRRFWSACDAIGDPSLAKLWGVNTCVKGEPADTVTTGFGTAPARFRNIEVG